MSDGARKKITEIQFQRVVQSHLLEHWQSSIPIVISDAYCCLWIAMNVTLKSRAVVWVYLMYIFFYWIHDGVLVIKLWLCCKRPDREYITKPAYNHSCIGAESCNDFATDRRRDNWPRTICMGFAILKFLHSSVVWFCTWSCDVHCITMRANGWSGRSLARALKCFQIARQGYRTTGSFLNA